MSRALPSLEEVMQLFDVNTARLFAIGATAVNLAREVDSPAGEHYRAEVLCDGHWHTHEAFVAFYRSDVVALEAVVYWLEDVADDLVL